MKAKPDDRYAELLKLTKDSTFDEILQAIKVAKVAIAVDWWKQRRMWVVGLERDGSWRGTGHSADIAKALSDAVRDLTRDELRAELGITNSVEDMTDRLVKALGGEKS